MSKDHTKATGSKEGREDKQKGKLTTPYNILHQLIQQRIRRLKVAGPLHIGVHDHSRDGVLVQGRLRRGPVVDLHVAEAVVRERRLPGLRAVAGEHEVVGLRRRS